MESLHQPSQSSCISRNCCTVVDDKSGWILPGLKCRYTTTKEGYALNTIHVDLDLKCLRKLRIIWILSVIWEMWDLFAILITFTKKIVYIRYVSWRYRSSFRISLLYRGSDGLVMYLDAGSVCYKWYMISSRQCNDSTQVRCLKS